MTKNELERMWKEAVMANFKVYPNIYLKILRKTTDIVRMAGIVTDIRTGNLPNISQKRYRLRQLFRISSRR
jgi:hypothetical protein